MSKQLVKEQLKALEQLESSGRVTGPRKNKRKKALSTDVTKIGQLRIQQEKEKQAAQQRNLELIGIFDSKEKELRKDGTKKKTAKNFIRRIEIHRQKDHERLYAKPTKTKKGKKRARAQAPDSDDDDQAIDDSSEEEPQPQSKKQKKADSMTPEVDAADLASFEKMAAQMLKGGGL